MIYDVLNLSFTVLQHVPPFCDYKVLIQRDTEAKRYLCSMIDLNMIEEEFRARCMKERRRAAFFVRQCEMDHEEDKEKR
jgi:hypothetical protein